MENVLRQLRGALSRTEPAEQKAKRKLKNYKLKHSRLLTCYSALLYLAAIYSKHRTVRPADVLHMISMTPTQRIEWMLAQDFLASAHVNLRQVIALYERFLESADASEPDLVNRFLDKAKSREYLKSASEFGDVVFQVLEAIDNKSPFHRLLVVYKPGSPGFRVLAQQRYESK